MFLYIKASEKFENGIMERQRQVFKLHFKSVQNVIHDFLRYLRKFKAQLEKEDVKSK